MKTLIEFKKELGLEKIPTRIGAKGREFAKIGKMTILVAKEFDIKQEAFVVEIEKDKNGVALTEVYCICNSNTKPGRDF